MTTPAAISTAGLTKHYDKVRALTDLTLDVPAGSIYGFLGPNGAGKTTVLKILAGLIDELTLITHPVVAGSKFRRLFEGADTARLELVRNELTSKGNVVSTYRLKAQ